MKNLFKKFSYKSIATLLLVLVSQASVFADTSNSNTSNAPLSGGMVVFYFAVLLALIIIPVFKKSNRSI